ncbi:MAG TPA: DnaJ domain-containing protein [Chloroflexota bacterium]
MPAIGPDDGRPPSEKARVEALAELGLPRRARIEEIRAAYLALARDLHPDRHPGDRQRAARFRRVAAAYELLRRYHRHLRSAGPLPRDGQRHDPLWWRLFGEKV